MKCTRLIYKIVLILHVDAVCYVCVGCARACGRGACNVTQERWIVLPYLARLTVSAKDMTAFPLHRNAVKLHYYSRISETNRLSKRSELSEFVLWRNPLSPAYICTTPRPDQAKAKFHSLPQFIAVTISNTMLNNSIFALCVYTGNLLVLPVGFWIHR